MNGNKNNPRKRILPEVAQAIPEFILAPEPLAVNKPAIEDATRELLLAIGEDPERDGLLKTPERVARMWEELTAGYHTDPEKLINGALFDVDYDEMVLVKDIEYYSLCEHHLLPFFGRAHVAYIPNGRVIGLSKIPRVVEMYARRLQVQERMTAEIAHFLMDTLDARGVAVVVEGSHMCAMMRGVKKPETNMTTSTFLGAFKEDRALRQEFLDQVNRAYHRD
ncbi:MAG TPA: GTP cyclohydrolase I FolE [Anaerolinea thermolimosa]|uniref:GTP cyclohydrolase 1 n=1 Tax=Anaerolinea thermolimosa TaxID=229919 RepID=A0A3D1JHF2_9CHLR|nr:GTP cyclohydrolase I FolE [Anaerolinea thermolimosa]